MGPGARTGCRPSCEVAGHRARAARPRTASRAWLAIVVAASLHSDPSLAYFERVQAGSRGVALGRSYAAVADDVSAVFWNPAGLVTMQRGEVLLADAHPFNIDGLRSNFAALALHSGRTSAAVAWHHTGVEDVLGEDLFYLSVARDLLPYGGRYALAAGVTLKAARVGFTDTRAVGYGRETQLTADLAMLLNVTGNFGIAYVLKNVSEPTFDFVPGDGGTIMERAHDLGVSYRWHPESVFAISGAQGARGRWSLNFGAEVLFYDVFAFRTGVTDNQFAGGVGLVTNRFLVDVAFLTHSELGMSYELSLRIPIGDARW